MSPLRRLGTWLLATWIGWSALRTDAAAASPGFTETVTTFSRSGQFVVTGPRPKPGRMFESLQPGQAIRELSPQTLAVSCERVKAEVLGALAVPDHWRAHGGRTGKILVSIDTTVRTNQPVAVQATPFETGWQFRVPLPTRLSEDRLVRAIVQAVLLEFANRSGNQRVGEPPLWLVEGITQRILVAVPEGIILQPQTRGTLEIKMEEQLAKVRGQLARAPALQFHELSHPDLTRMDSSGWAHYSACAHLFFRELTRLPEGQSRLTHWLGSLQQHWNWQTGFLDAFQAEFRSLLDTEKWWALTVANFTGRNPASAWAAPFALRKLDEALQPIGILPGAGGRASRMTVDDVIASWDYARQVAVLRQLLHQLHAIRIHSPPEVAPLAFRYVDVIEEYLAARNRALTTPVFHGQPTGNVKLISREAIGRLRELDGQRRILTEELANPA